MPLKGPLSAYYHATPHLLFNAKEIGKRTYVVQPRLIFEWESKQSYLEDAFCQMLIGQMAKLFQSWE